MVEPAEPGAMVFHPGEFIADELVARNLNPKALSCSGWNEERILKLLQGNDRMDYALAAHMREMWDISTEFWFRLQVQWDEYPDRREQPPWPRQFSEEGSQC